MNERITIAGHGGRLEIIVHGYERENASNTSDANWLNCTLRFEIGLFSGATRLSLETHDIESFCQELKSLLLSGGNEAELAPLEDVIQCKITPTKLGHALISGTVKTCNLVNAELSFSFDSDQSYLTLTGMDLETVIEAFPIRPR